MYENLLFSFFIVVINSQCYFLALEHFQGHQSKQRCFGLLVLSSTILNCIFKYFFKWKSCLTYDCAIFCFCILLICVIDLELQIFRSKMMAHEERQIRVAAETLLSGSLDSQRNSYTQSINRTPDTVFRENIIAGARTNGSMSNVRRFFCLFVTFDFFFTCLMWLICTVVIKSLFRIQLVFWIPYIHKNKHVFILKFTLFCFADLRRIVTRCFQKTSSLL